MGRLDTRYSPVRRSPSIYASVYHAAPRLACVKPVASVHPEPGSNSPLYIFYLLRQKFMQCLYFINKSTHASSTAVCLYFCPRWPSLSSSFSRIDGSYLLHPDDSIHIILYKVHETSASCTTCLSVYVNLFKERLSFCAFYITAECSKPFGQTPSFSKASAKVHTFYQSTKCFWMFFEKQWIFLCFWTG